MPLPGWARTRRCALAGVAALSLLGGPAPASWASTASSRPANIQGTGGMLFFGSDVPQACSSSRGTPAPTVRAMDRLGGALATHGRPLFMTVGPNKSTAVSERLPPAFAGRGCLLEASRAYSAGLRAAPKRSWTYLDYGALIEQAQARTGLPLYRLRDSHPDNYASLEFARMYAAALDPTVAASNVRVTPRTTTYTADMTARTQPGERAPGLLVTRDGVRVHPRTSHADRVVHVRSTTDGRSRLLDARVLFIGDSFTDGPMGYLPLFFSDITKMSVLNAQTPTATRLMEQADVVFVESVERSTIGTHALRVWPRAEQLKAIAALRAPDHAPQARLDPRTTPTRTGVSLVGRGWDPDARWQPLRTLVSLDGQPVRARTVPVPRPDLAAAFPGLHAAAGFRLEVPVPPGRHRLCATAFGVGRGGHRSLGCRAVTVPFPRA